MNLSDKAILELKEKKKEFYKELENNIKEINEDGTLYIPLVDVHYNYKYSFKTNDFLIIKKENDKLCISDTWTDEENKEPAYILIQNENNFQILKCKKSLLEIISLQIKKYNNINNEIKNII